MFVFFTRKSLLQKALLFVFCMVPILAHAQVPTNGLVAYYPFNGNANDESGNGNHGTVNGATLTTDRFGNANKAYSFDGNTNDILLNLQLGNQSAITISSWVKTNNSGNEIQAILSSSNSAGFHFQLSDNTVFNIVAYTGNQTGSFGITLPILPRLPNNTWRFLTVVYASGGSKIYENGNLIASSSETYNYITTSPLKIGSGWVGSRFFNGTIDDILIYNRALSHAEVTQLYNTEAPPVTLETGLVAYYPFNGNANDESGNGNNGVVNGATLTTDRFGNADKAYSFNGVNNIITVPNSTSLNITQNLTLSTWFKAEPSEDYKGIVTKTGTNLGGSLRSQYFFTLANISEGSKLRADILAQYTGGNYVLSNNNVADNQWHSGVVTFDGSVIKLFVDGQYQNQRTWTGPMISNDEPLRIGFDVGSPGNRYFKGLIDDISIYNRALSESEVQQLHGTYTASAPPVPTQLSSQIIKMGNASNAVFLLWQTTTSAKSYEIYRDGQLAGRNTNPIFRELLDAGTYSYQVVAVNDYGKSVKSQPLAVVVAGNSSDIHYGKLAIYIHTEDKNPIENAVITFTDGSDPIQTNKNGLALIESLPYGTAKTIASITKSGWTFEPEAGAANNYAIKIDKALHLIRVKGTAAANNTNTNSSYIPPYKADLLVYDVNAIVYPTFTKGNNYELKVNVRASSLAGWQGDIRLIAVRKDVLVNKEAPTFYIGQLTDTYVSVRGTELTFKAIDGKLNADVGKYELYIQTLSPQAYKPSYHNIAIDAATEASVTYGQIFVKEITIDNNTNFYTHQDIVEKVSSYIADGQEVWDFFGDLLKLQNNTLNGGAGDLVIDKIESINTSIEPLTRINDQIQFFKTVSDIIREPNREKRYYKLAKLIFDEATKGNPYAFILKKYLDVGESMAGAIDRIANGWNDGIVSPTIASRTIQLKVQKEEKKWRSRSYFTNAEVMAYLTKAEIVGTNRFGAPLQPVTLGISADIKDNTILNLDPSGFAQDEGSKLYLRFTFSNNHSLVIPIRSDFVKYEGNGGPILVVIGTNASQPTQIPDLFKIISPSEF